MSAGCFAEAPDKLPLSLLQYFQAHAHFFMGTAGFNQGALTTSRQTYSLLVDRSPVLGAASLLQASATGPPLKLHLHRPQLLTHLYSAQCLGGARLPEGLLSILPCTQNHMGSALWESSF